MTDFLYGSYSALTFPTELCEILVAICCSSRYWLVPYLATSFPEVGSIGEGHLHKVHMFV